MRPPETIKVLISHSEPLIAAGLAATLGRAREFESVTARAAVADVVICDYDSALRLMGSGSVLSRRVLILTHSDSEAKICHALEQGARGYLLFGSGLQELIEAVRSVHLGGIALAPLVASRIADRMKQQALTRREGDILRHMMLGMSNKAIASKLTLAVGTVKTHVKSVLEKLDASSRTQAVSIAQRRGLLREEEDSRHFAWSAQPPPSALMSSTVALMRRI